MGVTISVLGLGATLLAGLGCVGHRKLDDALKSLGSAFKSD